jgi:hypothetical protein
MIVTIAADESQEPSIYTSQCKEMVGFFIGPEHLFTIVAIIANIAKK